MFTDEKTGWAVGNGVVLSTSDGGASWNYAKEITGLFDKVEFVDSQVGWITERWLEESRFTINGGKTLTDIAFPAVMPPRGSELMINRSKQFVVAEPNGRIYLFDPFTGKTNEVHIESEEWNEIAPDSFQNPYIGRTLDGSNMICMVFDKERNTFLSIKSQDEGKTWH